MKSAVRQQHDGEWNKTVMQIVNEERRFTTWRVRMGALKSRLTEIRAAIAVGDDLSSGQQISRPPRFAQEKYTPDPASCAFEIHEWKLKMSQLGRLIPRFPRNNHSIEKNTELDHPASFDDVVRSPGKIANWSIEIGTRNEISIVLIIEKRKRNEIFRRSLFSQGKMDGFFLFEISRVKITFPRFSRVSPFYFSSLPFHFEPQRSPSFVSLLTHQLIVINNTLFEVWAKLLAWNCIFKFPFVIYRLFAAH